MGDFSSNWWRAFERKGKNSGRMQSFGIIFMGGGEMDKLRLGFRGFY